MTGLKERTVLRLVTKKRIPCIRIGKIIRFDPKDVSDWIDGSKVLVGQPGGEAGEETRGND